MTPTRKIRLSLFWSSICFSSSPFLRFSTEKSLDETKMEIE